MRLQKLICPAAFFLTAIVVFSGQHMIGQDLPTQEPGQSSAGTSDSRQTPAAQDKDKKAKPYKVSSRFHLQQGTNTGYLVVKVELAKGNFIYSLNQKSPLRPSKIRVADSQQFQLKSEFKPDRVPIVIENDPVFKQRVEKHKGEIQFFATVEIAPGVDVETLSADVNFGGQVCSEEGFCMPILGANTKGKFAGYFERTAEKRETSQSPSTGR
jgi:hypothetical protein